MAAGAVALPKKIGPIVSGTSHRNLRLGQPLTEEDLLTDSEPEELPSHGRAKRPAPEEDGGSDHGGRRTKKARPATVRWVDEDEGEQEQEQGGGASKVDEFPLKALVDNGLLRPGNRRLSIMVNGSRITAALMRNGSISYGGRFFSSPGTFASHVGKRSGPSARARAKQAEEDSAGWEAVKYDGQTLASFRRALRELQDDATEEEDDDEDLEDDGDAGEDDQEEGEDDGDEGGYWIQCDGCETWRIVPDNEWEALGADNLDTWYCEDATWDVREEVPHTAPCTLKPKAKKQASSTRKASRRR